jgi:predicted nucleotidyltransferase
VTVRQLELDIEQLLTLALAKVDVPEGSAVVLEGSLAEGFGNPGSDVDFLVLVDGEDQPTMPSVLFVGGRRVEVRTRSVRQVLEQFDTALAAPEEGVLDRCQRLLGALPVRGGELLSRLRDQLPADDFADALTAWFTDRARQALRYAHAMAQLDQADEAADWMRFGLLYSAKSWAARRGETYLEPKWLPAQLARIQQWTDTPQDLVRRYQAGVDSLAECVRLAKDFGVGRCQTVPGRVLLRQLPGVTTWPIGDRVHVVRDRDDVFVLDDHAGQVWRSIVFGHPPEETADRGVLAQFVRLGLVGLSWPGDGPIEPAARPITPPPGRACPVLSVLGGTVVGPVTLVPLPARRFCAAGLDLVWSNVLAENAREDLLGALAGESVAVAEVAARRMAQVACRGMFSAAGVHPLPPDGALTRLLCELPVVDRSLAEQARLVEQPPVSLAALDHFVAMVRANTGAGGFPSSFGSAAGWQRTIEIGHDWLRMAAYLDAELPIQDARDILSPAGVA